MTALPLKIVKFRSRRVRRRVFQQDLSTILIAEGALSREDADRAAAMATRRDVPLADILRLHGMADENCILAALALQWSTTIVDLTAERPDPRLIDAYGPGNCLRDAILPWRRVGGAVVVVTARPELFERRRPDLQELFGPVVMALAPEAAIHEAVLGLRRHALNRYAETMVPIAESCRSWDGEKVGRFAIWTGLIALGLLFLAPRLFILGLAFWAVVTLATTMVLKAAAILAEARGRNRPGTTPPATIARLPVVSIIVPLFREPGIAQRLVKRLARIDYPVELLDILLVVEEEDETTRSALDISPPPKWMRIVTAPAGALKTKPRALNFGLSFCRGSIVGIYDAEDAPAPDQVRAVVESFHARGPEVACLQGILDFGNPGTNWLSRCFTIEYAAWFRIVLPGLQRLGLAIPLGGTTLFFRRVALEELGGWDAHNVTEDADLGIRLARHGYRAEMIETVTMEEANCHALPWIKQRSRWLKGYMMTWVIHMRDPGLLLSQLGRWRFAGVQILFLGTLSQFLLAPVLWSFLLIPLGIWHPLAGLPAPVLWGVTLLFLLSETLNLALNVVATIRAGRRFLIPWILTMHFYFPLGALAVYKGAWELVRAPFYWDKTAHGLYDIDPVAAGSSAA